MSSDARELSGVKLTVKAALPSLRGRVVLVEIDNKVTQAYINHLGGRSPFLNHCSGSMVDVLLGTNPPRRSPSTREGECPSRPTVSLEARPHRHPAQPEGLQHDRPKVRATLSGSLRNSGQPAARPFCLMEAGSVGDCRRCLHVLVDGRESLLLPSRLLHLLASPRGTLATGDDYLVAPDWQAA